MIRQADQLDADMISIWLNDSRVCSYLTSNLRFGGITPALARAALRRPDQKWYVILDGEKGVGIVALDSIDYVDGIANLWYFIGDESGLGKGLATEAIKLLIHQLPAEIATLIAWVAEPNTASSHCLIKCGFRFVGDYKNAVVINGQKYDRQLYQYEVSR